MPPHSQARTAYASASSSIRTGRDAEYAVFARVTHALRTANSDRYPEVARAVTDNQRLWLALAEDLASDDNALPDALCTPELNLACKEGEQHSLVAELQRTATFPGASEVIRIDGAIRMAPK